MAKERIVIPADRPLISEENIATLNGKPIIGKNIGNIEIQGQTPIENLVVLNFSDVSKSMTAEQRNKILRDKSFLLYNERGNIYLHQTLIYRVSDSGNTTYIFGTDFVVNNNERSSFITNINNDNTYITQVINLDINGFSELLNSYTKFKNIKSLNYSLGAAIAVDAVGTVEINTLTDNKIIITSIKPTTAVEGLILSTPYYNGSCWCLTILNKSTSSFNGDLEIIYRQI